jgi:hypothetical protein
MIKTDSTAAAPADPEFITLQQFFTRFSITKSTWYRLANAGDASPIVKIGRRTLVRRPARLRTRHNIPRRSRRGSV